MLCYDGAVLWIYWLVVALVLAVVSRNVRYAIRQYWANRQRAVFSVYLFFLILFGYLLLHLTMRTLEFAQDVRQQDLDTMLRN